MFSQMNVDNVILQSEPAVIPATVKEVNGDANDGYQRHQGATG